MFFDLVSSITNLFSGWINGKLEIQKSKIETQKAAEANKTRLLADTASNNHAWEMAQITESDKPLRRVCFAILSWPFIQAVFDPQGVANYFTVGLHGIPAWYVKMFVGMVGAVWGLAPLVNSASQLINQLKK